MALFAQPVSMAIAPPPGKPMRLGQIISGTSAILALVLIILTVARNQTVQWGEIPRYMVDPVILDGVVLTLRLTAGAMVFGIAFGCIVAVMATIQNVVLKALAVAFVWWFRGVPLIVQIFFWFNIALFIRKWGSAAIPSPSTNSSPLPSLASSRLACTKPPI